MNRLFLKFPILLVMIARAPDRVLREIRTIKQLTLTPNATGLASVVS